MHAFADHSQPTDTGTDEGGFHFDGDGIHRCMKFVAVCGTRGHRHRRIERCHQYPAMGDMAGVAQLGRYRHEQLRSALAELDQRDTELVEKGNASDPTIRHQHGQRISKSPAAPMPPPMHIVTTPSLAPRRLPSISRWPVRRWPDTP